MPSHRTPPSKLTHGFAIVLGAFLLFQIQPLAAKAILPWFGGSAAVWTTCLLFFQAGLLLGYLYAHGLICFLGPRAQAWVHLGLLAASLVLLPVNPSLSWKPLGTEDPTFRILGLLTLSLGLPYALLAATSPLLQAWSARSHAESLPWRLYALSNAGSLVALLSYPVFVEPYLGVAQQMHLWSAAFGAFVLLCGAVAWRTARTAPRNPGPQGAPKVPPSPAFDRALWIALPACASVLLLAVSSHLTQNVAAVPFLWVLPLSLYLLTFIFCFEGRGWYRRIVFMPLLLLFLGAMTLFLSPASESTNLWLLLPVFGLGLVACCMVCHGELARLRPHPAHLTAFYLHIATGGALGGLFVGLLAPRIFRGYWELPLGLAACAFLALATLWRSPRVHEAHPLFRPARAVVALASLAITAGLGWQTRRIQSGQRLMVRDFYGGLRVSDWSSRSGEDRIRMLRHGIVTHGEQFLDSVRRRQPTAYYSPFSGAALALTRDPRPEHQKVGIVGLGAGTLAAYGRPGDEYRFYEIDPLMVDLARTQFVYLADSRASIKVVLGDGRLALEREPDQNFDVLVVDAFSGDAIPTHLLTREAFALYRRHLKPGGMMAIHITNGYLDLAPVVAQGATGLDFRALEVQARPDGIHLWRGSTWVLLSEGPETVQLWKGQNLGRYLVPEPGLRPWTDDYSNLLGVLKH